MVRAAAGGQREPPASFERSNRIAVRVVLGLGVIFALATVLVVMASFWAYAGHDRIGLIDDPVIDETASRACSMMSAAVTGAAPSTGDSSRRAAAAIRAQNDAVLTMVATVRDLGDDRLGGDHPSAAWLADWETLVQAREAQADLVDAGAPASFVVPRTDDGYPITTRMSEAMTSCEVPAELVASWP